MAPKPRQLMVMSVTFCRWGSMCNLRSPQTANKAYNFHKYPTRRFRCWENCDSQTCFWELAQTEHGTLRNDSDSLHEYTNLLEYDFGTTDGFKKRLLKCENQIVDFLKATVKCSMKIWKVTLCSQDFQPQSKNFLRVQNRGDYGTFLVALMIIVTAQYRWRTEWWRARKETKARRAMAKESMTKVWENTTKVMSTARDDKNKEYGRWR